MRITLQPITRDNWHECIALRLTERQQRYMATNLYSLAQAFVEPACRPLAIYAGRRMVGFSLYEVDHPRAAAWIVRFMIDCRLQGQGYGARALRALLDHLREHEAAQNVGLSVVAANGAARRFYRSFGFEETGEHSHGEDVFRLALDEADRAER